MDLTFDLNKHHSPSCGFNNWRHQSPDACVLHDHPNPRVELSYELIGFFVHGVHHGVTWVRSPDPALTGDIPFDFPCQPSIGHKCESRPEELAAALTDAIGRALGGGKGDGRRSPKENHPMNMVTSTSTKRSRKMAREPQASAIPVIKPQTKASLVEGLLLRDAGASLADLSQATGWLPHTCRAFLTGLREKGRFLERAKREDGVTIYKLALIAGVA